MMKGSPLENNRVLAERKLLIIPSPNWEKEIVTVAEPRVTHSLTAPKRPSTSSPPPSSSTDAPANRKEDKLTMAMSSGHEDEGVLKDVLEELDRERAERAELEASVRTLQLEVQKYKAAAEQPQQKEPTKDSSAAQAIDKQQYTKYEYLV